MFFSFLETVFNFLEANFQGLGAKFLVCAKIMFFEDIEICSMWDSERFFEGLDPDRVNFLLDLLSFFRERRVRVGEGGGGFSEINQFTAYRFQKCFRKFKD